MRGESLAEAPNVRVGMPQAAAAARTLASTMLCCACVAPVYPSSSFFLICFLFGMLSRICQGMSWQHLHQPCLAVTV